MRVLGPGCEKWQLPFPLSWGTRSRAHLPCCEEAQAACGKTHVERGRSQSPAPSPGCCSSHLLASSVMGLFWKGILQPLIDPKGKKPRTQTWTESEHWVPAWPTCRAEYFRPLVPVSQCVKWASEGPGCESVTEKCVRAGAGPWDSRRSCLSSSLPSELTWLASPSWRLLLCPPRWVRQPQCSGPCLWCRWELLETPMPPHTHLMGSLGTLGTTVPRLFPNFPSDENSLGLSLKCRFLGPSPGWLSQSLWGRELSGHLEPATMLTGESGNMLHF